MKYRLLLTMIVSLMVIVPPFVQAKPFFSISPIDIPSKSLIPAGLVTGDFNNDGNMDMILNDNGNLANNFFDTSEILLGNGRGGFKTVQRMVKLGVRVLFTGDFNNDGKLDLIASYGLSTKTKNIGILLGNGKGKFLRPKRIFVIGDWTALSQFTSSYEHMFQIGDYNRDGNLDLAFAFSGMFFRQIKVFLGNGKGRFWKPINSTVGRKTMSIYSLVTPDFDNDGILDMAVFVNGFDAKGINKLYLFVAKGDGTGKFLKGKYISPKGVPPSDQGRIMISSDFNGDGFADIVTTSSTGFFKPFRVTISLNNHKAGFTTRSYLTYVGDNSLFVRDLNADGFPELLEGAGRTDGFVIRPGNRFGTYARRIHFAVPAQSPPSPSLGSRGPTLYLATADFNNDGVMDLVAQSNPLSFMNPGGYSVMPVSLWLGSAPTLKLAGKVLGGRVKLSWNKVAGATSYSVYRRAPWAKKMVKIAIVKKGSLFIDRRVKAKTLYIYRVIAFKGKVRLKASNITKATLP